MSQRLNIKMFFILKKALKIKKDETEGGRSGLASPDVNSHSHEEIHRLTLDIRIDVITSLSYRYIGPVGGGGMCLLNLPLFSELASA